MQGFYCFTFRRKGCTNKLGTIQIINVWEESPRVSAWHPSYSDSTWYHDIKSINNYCGTFTTWLRHTSTRLICMQKLRHPMLAAKSERENGQRTSRETFRTYYQSEHLRQWRQNLQQRLQKQYPTDVRYHDRQRV